MFKFLGLFRSSSSNRTTRRNSLSTSSGSSSGSRNRTRSRRSSSSSIDITKETDELNEFADHFYNLEETVHNLLEFIDLQRDKDGIKAKVGRAFFRTTGLGTDRLKFKEAIKSHKYIEKLNMIRDNCKENRVFLLKKIEESTKPRTRPMTNHGKYRSSLEILVNKAKSDYNALYSKFLTLKSSFLKKCELENKCDQLFRSHQTLFQRKNHEMEGFFTGGRHKTNFRGKTLRKK
jgi:hypothetical protein